MSISQHLIDNSSRMCVSRVTCSINPPHLTTWAQVQGVSIWMPAPHDADAAMALLRHTLTCEALLSVESAVPVLLGALGKTAPRRFRPTSSHPPKVGREEGRSGVRGVLSLVNIRQYGETPLPSSRPACVTATSEHGVPVEPGWWPHLQAGPPPGHLRHTLPG